VLTDRAVESVREAMKAAEDCGVLFCVEVVNRFEHYMLNTAEEGVAFAKQVGSPNCKLLLDTFHMNIEEESFRGALVETGDLLGHFHLSETNRRPPGTGRMPWPEIFGALREINYQGAVTMEPFLLPGGEVGRDVSVYPVLPGADNRDEEATRSVQFVFRDEQGGGIDDANVHRVFQSAANPKPNREVAATMFADTLAKQLDHYNREHGQALSKADLRGYRLHDFVRSEHREWVRDRGSRCRRSGNRLR
jgi:hypothetical protein